MQNWLTILAFLIIPVYQSAAQDQFLGRAINEVRSQLDKRRIVYTEQTSPMGDMTTLSYSVSETSPNRVDLFFSHALSFPQANQNRCNQVISIPMLQKPWVPDTLENRMLESGYKKLDDGRFVHEKFDQLVILDYVRDTQQPNVRMLRLVFRQRPKPAEK
ncbi:hypothetical protein ACO2Q8_02065 [Larkinella sp. VNQ87]|uniref:hypothetical protein n=1 Tax=Larkinella sp. VNQ87 TaxID=3400921 RepID=UPI003C105113